MTQAWAIKGPDGKLLFGHMGKHDYGAMDSLCAHLQITWAQATALGYTCVPVTLVEGSAEKSRDTPCVEDDGCPTELAVLQRFWRERNGSAEPVAQIPMLGGVYETQDGRRVKMVAINNAGEPHETLVDEAGVNRYSRRLYDFGRVTGSAHDYSDPANLKRPIKVIALYHVTAPPADDARRLLERAEQIIRRYRKETPLGHQPHMIALDAEELADAIREHLARSGE